MEFDKLSNDELNKYIQECSFKVSSYKNEQMALKIL